MDSEILIGFSKVNKMMFWDIKDIDSISRCANDIYKVNESRKKLKEENFENSELIKSNIDDDDDDNDNEEEKENVVDEDIIEESSEMEMEEKSEKLQKEGEDPSQNTPGPWNKI